MEFIVSTHNCFNPETFILETLSQTESQNSVVYKDRNEVTEKILRMFIYSQEPSIVATFILLATK